MEDVQSNLNPATEDTRIKKIQLGRKRAREAINDYIEMGKIPNYAEKDYGMHKQELEKFDDMEAIYEAEKIKSKIRAVPWSNAQEGIATQPNHPLYNKKTYLNPETYQKRMARLENVKRTAKMNAYITLERDSSYVYFSTDTTLLTGFAYRCLAKKLGILAPGSTTIENRKHTYDYASFALDKVNYLPTLKVDRVEIDMRTENNVTSISSSTIDPTPGTQKDLLASTPQSAQNNFQLTLRVTYLLENAYYSFYEFTSPAGSVIALAFPNAMAFSEFTAELDGKLCLNLKQAERLKRIEKQKDPFLKGTYHYATGELKLQENELSESDLRGSGVIRLRIRPSSLINEELILKSGTAGMQHVRVCVTYPSESIREALKSNSPHAIFAVRELFEFFNKPTIDILDLYRDTVLPNTPTIFTDEAIGYFEKNKPYYDTILTIYRKLVSLFKLAQKTNYLKMKISEGRKLAAMCVETAGLVDLFRTGLIPASVAATMHGIFKSTKLGCSSYNIFEIDFVELSDILDRAPIILTHDKMIPELLKYIVNVLYNTCRQFITMDIEGFSLKENDFKNIVGLLRDPSLTSATQTLQKISSSLTDETLNALIDTLKRKVTDSRNSLETAEKEINALSFKVDSSMANDDVSVAYQRHLKMVDDKKQHTTRLEQRIKTAEQDIFILSKVPNVSALTPDILTRLSDTVRDTLAIAKDMGGNSDGQDSTAQSVKTRKKRIHKIQTELKDIKPYATRLRTKKLK